MNAATQTLAAVNQAIENNAEKPFRRHLGASEIGDECARRIFYKWRWVSYEKFDARMLRLFERGHLEEKRFVGYLRAAGVEVWETDPSTKEQWRITGFCNHFGGGLDGVGRGIPDLPPGTPFLLEFKTHNDKSFKNLKADGIMKTKWKHFVQMQVYMGGYSLKFALYCAVNKDTDEILMELVQYDEREDTRARTRAHDIIFATEPPARVNPSPGYWLCKFCHFNRLCHFGDQSVERNCRTCIHAIPSKDGSGDWLCTQEERTDKFGDMIPLNEDAQRKGCEDYQLNPVLTNIKA